MFSREEEEKMTELEVLMSIDYKLEFIISFLLFLFILLIFFGVIKLLNWIFN